MRAATETAGGCALCPARILLTELRLRRIFILMPIVKYIYFVCRGSCGGAGWSCVKKCRISINAVVYYIPMFFS